MNGRNEIVITQYRDRPILLYQSENKPYDLVVGELQQEEAPQVGDIYVGRVQNIVQNIRAVFVEIKEGVICYLSETEYGGKKIHVGDELVVQVKKAAVKTKQPVVTQVIELVGYYCVVTTGNSRNRCQKNRKGRANTPAAFAGGIGRRRVRHRIAYKCRRGRFGSSSGRM